MTYVLSFDPGGTTGYCYQTEDKVMVMEDIHKGLEGMKAFIKKWDFDKLPVDTIVVEGYFTLGHKVQANTNRTMYESEIIGIIKGWAALNDIKLVEYMPKLKPAQAKLTQVFAKKATKDIEHRLDAYNHGRYYLIKEHGAPTALMIKMKKEGSV